MSENNTTAADIQSVVIIARAQMEDDAAAVAERRSLAALEEARTTYLHAASAAPRGAFPVAASRLHSASLAHTQATERSAAAAEVLARLRA